MGRGRCLGAVHGLFRGSGAVMDWESNLRPVFSLPRRPPPLRLSLLLSLNTEMKPTEIRSAT